MTQGMPSSRATMAPWLIWPPRSMTTPPARWNSDTQPGSVVRHTRMSPGSRSAVAGSRTNPAPPVTAPPPPPPPVTGPEASPWPRPGGGGGGARGGRGPGPPPPHPAGHLALVGAVEAMAQQEGLEVDAAPRQRPQIAQERRFEHPGVTGDEPLLQSGTRRRPAHG